MFLKLFMWQYILTVTAPGRPTKILKKKTKAIANANLDIFGLLLTNLVRYFENKCLNWKLIHLSFEMIDSITDIKHLRTIIMVFVLFSLQRQYNNYFTVFEKIVLNFKFLFLLEQNSPNCLVSDQRQCILCNCKFFVLTLNLYQTLDENYQNHWKL